MKIKKMLAPILISVLFILFWGAALLVIWFESKDLLVNIFMTIPFAGLIVCMILVLRQRLREIEKGEEDDLDNY